MRKLKNFLLNLGISLLSLTIVLILVEFVSRIYVNAAKVELYQPGSEFISNDHSLHQFDEVIGWTLAPNHQEKHVYVNSTGFRSTQELRDSTDNRKKKIFLLGDSMVFGAGEDQDSIFPESLNRRSDDYFFINSGVVGYNNIQEYLTLKKFIDKINPDLVVLFYTQENDMWWNSRPGSYNAFATIENGELVLHKPEKKFKVPFYKTLVSYKLMSKHILQGKDLTYIFQKLDFALFKENSNVWKVTDFTLAAIGDLCKKHGANLMVFDVPTKGQVDTNAQPSIRQELLRKLCEREDFIYYDLLELYPENKIELFIPNDSHWNSKGHKFIADLLLDKINENSSLIRQSDHQLTGEKVN